MKDHTKNELEGSRPEVTAEEAISFCLREIYKNKTKRTLDGIFGGKYLYDGSGKPELTYEEVIGAFLLAKDFISECREKHKRSRNPVEV